MTFFLIQRLNAKVEDEIYSSTILKKNMKMNNASYTVLKLKKESAPVFLHFVLNYLFIK